MPNQRKQLNNMQIDFGKCVNETKEKVLEIIAKCIEIGKNFTHSNQIILTLVPF